MYEAGKLERVAVELAPGRTELLTLLVVRAVSLTIDCGCYTFGHALRHFTLIWTYSKEHGDGCYVRQDGDHVFHAMDISGPVRLEVERLYTPT